MNQHWFEELRFSVEVFDERGNLKEVLARLHDLDAARAAYMACHAKYPAKIIYARAAGRCGGATVMTRKCARCEDMFWVCDAHDDMPSEIGTSPPDGELRGSVSFCALA